MRIGVTISSIVPAALLVLSAQAGVEIVMQSKLDIPGAKLKIMGKDFSQSEQRFLVDDAAMLKGTVTGNRTNWIDLKREAFFDQTKRNCTVTTFAEMEERLEAMQGQDSPFSFMGGGDDDRAQRDPSEFDVRFDIHAGPPATVAGLTGKSSQIEVEVVDKQSGEMVSKIDIDNLYVDSDELELLQEFDRKMAERQVKALGAALGMDFNAMRGKMMGRPEMHRALEEMRKSGIGKNQTVARTVTRITSTRPPERAESDASAKDVAADDASTEEPQKRGRLATRMMAKMKERQDRKRATKSTTTTTTTTSDESGAPQPMTFSSELQSINQGVEVSLPQACVVAYEKKKK